MFQQLKNIDTAFQYVRLFSLVTILAFAITCCYTVYKCLEMVKEVQEKIYVLVNDKAVEAFQSERKDNIEVEARDHVKMFHYYFFTLVPDEKAIEETVTQALYLADESAKRQHDNLRESRYYASIVSGNISQKITMDSVQVDLTAYPYYFRYYGKQQITRSTTVVTRSLITEGYLRDLATRTDTNNHGFLIERWTTIENKNIKVENR